jgi:hypothetical protein
MTCEHNGYVVGEPALLIWNGREITAVSNSSAQHVQKFSPASPTKSVMLPPQWAS